MPKKKINEIAGVIDIGSNELRLKIAQSSASKMKVIEALTYPLSLGRDTFDTGTVSFEKMNKACEIIQNFLKVAAEYGVTKLRAVATTAVREAGNRDYILDLIKIKTGVSVEVLDDSQEKLYIYKLMSHLLDDGMKKSALMAYTGSGNVGVAVLAGGKMPFMQNIKVGSLRISELFFEIQESSAEFYMVLEEYLMSFMDVLEGMVAENIVNFIASGQEIELIAKLCAAGKKNSLFNIPISRFNSVYDDIKHKSTESIADAYGIPLDKAELLLPAMCVFRNLMQLSKSDRIFAMPVFLIESLLFEQLFPAVFADIDKEFSKNAILSARRTAEKFEARKEHYERVRKFSLTIFDVMKKIHGLGAKEKLLLNIAAILHDVGKFIDINKHYLHSWYIVQNCDIVGLSKHEIEIVAHICLYHSRLLPDASRYGYGGLSHDDRVLVSKLAAILRMADALDRSHELKFDAIQAEVAGNELIISVTTDKNIHLEQWSFDDKSNLFSEVFGMKAALRKKKKMYTSLE